MPDGITGRATDGFLARRRRRSARAHATAAREAEAEASREAAPKGEEAERCRRRPRLDHRRERPPGRDRRAERRGPSAEHPARPSEQPKPAAAGAERRARREGLRGSLLAADPGSREGARLRPGRSRHDRLRRPDAAAARVTGRLANRRIRLLLAVFALVFGATLLRAVWLRGDKAQTLGRMAARLHRL